MCMLRQQGGIPGERTYQGAVHWVPRQLPELTQPNRQPDLLELLRLLPLR